MGAPGWEGHWRQTANMNRDRGRMTGGYQGDTGEVQEEDTRKQIGRDRLRPEYAPLWETGSVSAIFPTEREGFGGSEMWFAKGCSHHSPAMLRATQQSSV